MAGVHVEHHQPRFFARADTHIGAGEIILPPCSTRVLVRCGICGPFGCPGVLALVWTCRFTAGTLPSNRYVNRENCSATLGIPESSTQKNFSRVPFYPRFKG